MVIRFFSIVEYYLDLAISPRLKCYSIPAVPFTLSIDLDPGQRLWGLKENENDNRVSGCVLYGISLIFDYRVLLRSSYIAKT